MQPEALKIQQRIRELYQEFCGRVDSMPTASTIETEIETLRWVLQECFHETPWIVEHNTLAGSLPNPEKKEPEDDDAA